MLNLDQLAIQRFNGCVLKNDLDGDMIYPHRMRQRMTAVLSLWSLYYVVAYLVLQGITNLS